MCSLFSQLTKAFARIEEPVRCSDNVLRSALIEHVHIYPFATRERGFTRKIPRIVCGNCCWCSAVRREIRWSSAQLLNLFCRIRIQRPEKTRRGNGVSSKISFKRINCDLDGNKQKERVYLFLLVEDVPSHPRDSFVTCREEDEAKEIEGSKPYTHEGVHRMRKPVHPSRG